MLDIFFFFWRKKILNVAIIHIKHFFYNAYHRTQYYAIWFDVCSTYVDAFYDIFEIWSKCSPIF